MQVLIQVGFNDLSKFLFPNLYYPDGEIKETLNLVSQKVINRDFLQNGLGIGDRQCPPQKTNICPRTEITQGLLPTKGF